MSDTVEKTRSELESALIDAYLSGYKDGINGEYGKHKPKRRETPSV
jgi:hypothetical protein